MKDKVRYPCGFCGIAKGSDGQWRCGDILGNCPGTIKGAAAYSPENPERIWECPCSAGGHPGKVVVAPDPQLPGVIRLHEFTAGDNGDECTFTELNGWQCALPRERHP